MRLVGAVKWYFMAEQHYFSSEPQGDFVPKSVSVELAGSRVQVLTASGIFSPAGVDKGTQILLDTVPLPRGNNLLDIGTGWGPITLSLALLRPDAQVFGVEVNQRSAELTRLNAQKLNLPHVQVFAPADLDPTLRFDTIWSNPPIRVGKEALHDILRTWLPRLAVGGNAFLVVQKNLGADSLQKWLETDLHVAEPAAFEVSRYATSKGFRILQVQRLAQ